MPAGPSQALPPVPSHPAVATASARHPVRSLRRVACCLALLLLCAAGSVDTLADNGKRGSGQGQGNARGLSADQAAERVRKQTGGRVLRVDQTGDGYRVKVLTPAGEVREITVPAGRR